MVCNYIYEHFGHALNILLGTYTNAIVSLFSVLNENLKAYYEDVSVEIVDCPDLTQSPFELPVQGM